MKSIVMDASDLLQKYNQAFEGCKASGRVSTAMVFAYHVYRTKTTDFVSLEYAIKHVTEPAEASNQLAQSARFPTSKYVVKMDSAHGYVVIQRACETEEGVLFNVPPGSNAAMYTKGFDATVSASLIPPHVTVLFDDRVSAHLTPYKSFQDGTVKCWNPSATINKHVELTRPSMKELLAHEPTAQAAEEFGAVSEFTDLCTKAGKHMQRVSGATMSSGTGGATTIHRGAAGAIRKFVSALESYPRHCFNPNVHTGIACISIFSTARDWFGIVEHEASQKAVRIAETGVVSESPFWHAWTLSDDPLEQSMTRDFEQDFRRLLEDFFPAEPTRK